MKTAMIKGLKNASNINTAAFIICTAFFVCGCIAGTFASGATGEGSALYDYLSEYLQIAQEGQMDTGFLTVFAGCVKYHIAAIIFGFSILGIVSVPALGAVRGFFLTFSISSIVRVFGGQGILLSLSVFGISSFLTLPCFFILSTQSFTASAGMFSAVLGHGPRLPAELYRGGYISRCVICIMIVLIAAVLDRYIVNELIKVIAANI